MPQFAEPRRSRSHAGVLVAPVDVRADEAVQTVEAIHAALDRTGIPRRGSSMATAKPHGCPSRMRYNGDSTTRIGLEDTTLRPNGTRAAGNAALVRAARELGAGK